MIDSQAVATATALPLDVVTPNWDAITDALALEGIDTDLVRIAAAATVATETPRFQPVRELRANRIRQPQLYALQERYWASGYFGRGYVQRTWEHGYSEAGEWQGINFLAQPDLLLQPLYAARDLAGYFRRRSVATAAEAREWETVRKKVNGGTRGWDRFIGVVNRLVEGI